MPSPQKIKEFRMLMTQVFLEQAQPIAIGKPKVWAKQFGDSVTTAEVFGKVAKTSLIPFAKASIRTDFRIFYQIPTKLGDVFGVQHFSGMTLQPTDYIFILNHNIPRTTVAAKAKGLMGDDHWATELTEKGQQDPFAEFLLGLERKEGMLPDKPLYHARWTYSLGKMSVEVPYTMALMPVGDGRTLFLCKINYRPGFFKVSQNKFDLEEGMMLAEWLDEALTQFRYEGEPTPLNVSVPALSLLAVPEIAQLFDYQGEDVDWPVDLSGFQSAAPKPTPAVVEPITEDFKFCTKCGEKLKPDAAFCSKCGAKQD